MYDRFTDAARAVVARAEAEAFARGAAQVDPEDVVVALALHDGVAGNVLRAVAADVEVLRAGVAVVAPPVEHDPARARPLPLSHAAAAAFSIAAREADGLRLPRVGTEHLLLGLLREPGGRAGALLLAVRRDPGMVRERILDLVSSPGFVSPEVPAPEPAAPSVDDRSADAREDVRRTDPEPVLRALVHEVGRLREELAGLRDEVADLRGLLEARGGDRNGRHIA